ncbi:hypothetical protein [Bacillus wiedmannii]|nr:hypothetical protein [Bacillus wiedmannii]
MKNTYVKDPGGWNYTQKNSEVGPGGGAGYTGKGSEAAVSLYRFSLTYIV